MIPARRGHFRFESGHHGDTWLELELLYLRPARLRDAVSSLARRLAPYEVDAVCGPLVEGAFVALQVAEELGVDFTYAERIAHPEREGLYPVEYRLPRAQREVVRGRRVAIVNDVINAGSAVRGAYDDLLACGAEPVAIGALLVLGSWTGEFVAATGLALQALDTRENNLWEPSACPLCEAGVPVIDLSAQGTIAA